MSITYTTTSGTTLASGGSQFYSSTPLSTLVYTTDINTDYSICSSINPYSRLSFEGTIKNLLAIPNLSESLIRALILDKEASQYLVFDDIVKYQQLSEDFINEYYDKFTQSEIYKNQKLSMEFIEKHKSKIFGDNESLYQVSLKTPLSKRFITNNIDKLNISALLHNPYVSFTAAYIEKHYDVFNKNSILTVFGASNTISTKEYNKLLSNHIDDQEFIENQDWIGISWNRELTEANISQVLAKLDFRSNLLASRKFKDDSITCYRLLEFGF